jgi:hypothetical protein
MMGRFLRENSYCRQPDSGNPTVRDEKGACGNVSYGGTRNPLYKPKGYMLETLCLRLRAPYFYPTVFILDRFTEPLKCPTMAINSDA